jgi:hypothetical protein
MKACSVDILQVGRTAHALATENLWMINARIITFIGHHGIPCHDSILLYKKALGNHQPIWQRTRKHVQFKFQRHPK